MGGLRDAEKGQRRSAVPTLFEAKAPAFVAVIKRAASISHSLSFQGSGKPHGIEFRGVLSCIDFRF